MAEPGDLTSIAGIRGEPVRRRGGGVYDGRYTVRDPMLVLNPDDIHATASLSIRELSDAAGESGDADEYSSLAIFGTSRYRLVVAYRGCLGGRTSPPAGEAEDR